MSKNTYWVVDYDDPKNPRVLEANLTEKEMLEYKETYGAIYEHRKDAVRRLYNPEQNDPWRKAVVA